jgi:hypothetical protein
MIDNGEGVMQANTHAFWAWLSKMDMNFHLHASEDLPPENCLCYYWTQARRPLGQSHISEEPPLPPPPKKKWKERKTERNLEVSTVESSLTVLEDSERKCMRNIPSLEYFKLLRGS